jgi:hypothetical protein
VAITAVTYSFQPPRNVGTHKWESGVSIGVHGQRVPGPRRSGGGPGGGCARRPVGIPSPPRGGR